MYNIWQSIFNANQEKDAAIDRGKLRRRVVMLRIEVNVKLRDTKKKLRKKLKKLTRG